MNKQKWLIVGLSLAMAASLGVGISACGGEKDPDTPGHTHEYTQWEHSDTQHWMVCPDDGEIWAQGKQAHDFTNGDCVCGAKKPGEGGDETPDADLDTREFYVVGGGMGTLKNGTWDGPKTGFQFAKAPHKDANGNTVYTFTMELYSADEFKFIEQNTISTTEKDEEGNFLWDEATTFMLADLDVTAVPEAFSGNDNIVVNTNADGIYKFTLLTKKGGLAKENKMKVELVETIEALDIEAQYEMYLVGAIFSKSGCNWPGNFSSLSEVTTKCYKMELQEDGRTFSVEVKLRPEDAFKVWNYKLGNKDAGYYPTGLGGDLKVSEDGWYVVSWKVGEAMPKITPHEHRYTEWGHDAVGHWKQCPIDQAIDEETREEHTFSEGKCECGALEADSCAHDGKVNYEYAAVPEAVAEGSTLKGKCAKCGKEVDVEYKKGFTGNGSSPMSTTPNDNISEVGTYYFTTGRKFQTLGMKITEAGTYTLTFEEVCDLNNGQGQLGLVELAFNTNTYASFIIPGVGAYSMGTVGVEQITTYSVQVNGKTPTTSYDFNEDLVTFSFTVTAEQLSPGDVYVTLHLSGFTNDGHSVSAAADSLSHLVTVTNSAAETISAPAEVALLPGKED